MKNIKKLKSYGKAVAGSALLVGATLTGAAGLAAAQSGSSGDSYTLSDYPAPFVDDEGNLDSTVVVGSDGKQADVVSAIDIAGNLGNNAFSSQTVEGTAGAVDGEAFDEVTVGTTFGATIDASDYSGFVRKTVEDDDGNDVFVTESASISDVKSRINGTTTDLDVQSGEVSYTVKYSPGFEVNDTITLLGEEYELVNFEDSGDTVKLGSTVSNDVTVGDSFTHGPYTVEVVGKTSGDNPEPVVRVSKGEETLDRKALSENEELTVGSDDEFTVSAETVIFYEDGTTDITLESTYTDTTLENGEELPMDSDYEIPNNGISTQKTNDNPRQLQSITVQNKVSTTQDPEDADETGYVEVGQSFAGPNDYFSLTNQGLTNEATTEIGISSGGEVDFTDAQSFDASVDMSEVSNGQAISSDDTVTGISSDEGYVPLQVSEFNAGSSSSNAEATVQYQNFEKTFTAPDTLTSTSKQTAEEDAALRSVPTAGTSDLVTGSDVSQKILYDIDPSGGPEVGASGYGTIATSGYDSLNNKLDYSDVTVTASFSVDDVNTTEGTLVQFTNSGGEQDTINVSSTGDYSITLGDGSDEGYSASGDTASTGTEQNSDWNLRFGDVEAQNSYDHLGFDNDINVTVNGIDTGSAKPSEVSTQSLSFNAGGNSNGALSGDATTEFELVRSGSTGTATEGTVSSGYGFSVTPTFVDTDGDSHADEVDVANTAAKMTSQYDADITWKSSNSELAIHEENGGYINVTYSGADGDIVDPGVETSTGNLNDYDDGDSTLSTWGSAVELSSESSATVTYPDEQRYQMAAFGAIGEGTSAGEVMTPTGWPADSAQLDTEVSTDQNLVLIGGPLVNDLTADLASQDSTWNATQYENNQDVGVLDLVNNAFNGNNALVVAGWNAEDTSAAADYLVNNAGASELEGKTTVQVNTESGELVQ